MPWLPWIVALATTLLLFASVLLHELSHSFVAINRGINVGRITLFIFGGLAQVDEDPETPRDELLISVAGPAMSLLLALVFAGLYWLSQSYTGLYLLSRSMQQVAFINVALAVFNMAPGFPLDGGRITRSLLWYAWDDKLRATRVASLFGQIVGYGLVALGVFFGIAAHAIWIGIFYVGMGLLLSTIARATYQREQVLQSLSEVPVHQVSVAPQMWFPAGTPLTVAAPNLRAYQPKGWAPILRTNQPVGILRTKSIEDIPRHEWRGIFVEHVMDPLTENIVVRNTSSASEAFEKMSRGGGSTLLAIDSRGNLSGVVTKSTLRATAEAAG